MQVDIDEEHFLKRIEKLRHYLVEMAKERAFTDPLVVQVSQSLDSLLNEYYHFQRKLSDTNIDDLFLLKTHNASK